MGEHLYTYDDPPNERHLDQIVDVLRGDGVIAVPTGTNWAFAASATSKKAEKRLRRLKPEHPADRPFALLCSDIAMAATMTWVDGRAYRRLKRLWPGPYTVLLKANHDLPRVLKTKRAIVGVRIPEEPLLRIIVERFGGPLMVSTVPEGPDARPYKMGYEVHEAVGHGVDLVVDLGQELPGTETTVLSLVDGELEVLRVGVGPVDAL